MGKLLEVFAKHLEGQKQTQLCPVCNLNTEFLCHKDGTAVCTTCNTKGEIDFTDIIAELKRCDFIK